MITPSLELSNANTYFTTSPNLIENKEKNKKEDNAKDLEALRSKYGQEIDDFKKEVKNAKVIQLQKKW